MSNPYNNDSVAFESDRIIKKWRGGYAGLFTYRVSHRCLVIRIDSEQLGERYLPDLLGKYLHINCFDCRYIAGPFEWENCSFEIERSGKDESGQRFMLRDSINNFVLDCGYIEAHEYGKSKLEEAG